MKTSFLVLWLALCASVIAQIVPEPAAAPADPVPAVPSVVREQTVYVPFDKLEEVFEHQERGVFLPYREFLELWNKLNLPEKLKGIEPPVEGVLAAASYTGRVDGDVAEVKAKLNFEALKEGWSRLKLGAGNLSIAEVKSKALLNYADGGYEVIFPAKGAYQLDATLYGKIERAQGRNSVRFHLPKTAVSQLELSIADKGLEFAITPASAFSATENPDGSTRLVIYFGASEEVDISWTKKIGESALTPLLFADAALEMRVGAGAVRTEVAMNYRVLRAGVSAFDLAVPADQQVLSVDGANLREWKLEPAAAGVQKLHVALHTPARDNYSLKIKLESALPALPQQVKFPVVQAQAVERQSGSISVAADPELVVDVPQILGLTQQAAIATEPARNPVGSYRFLRMPYSGLFSVSEAKPQIEAASQTLLVVETDLLQLRATFNYTVKKSGIFGTQIELPAGFSTAEATGDEIESATVQKAGDRNVLQIRFSIRRSGAFSFQVTAEAPRAKPEDAVTVPVFVVQNAERHEAKVGLAVHVSLKSNTTTKGDLREEDIGNLGDLKISQPERTPLTLGFRYRGAAKPGQVQFELRKPRVSVEVFSLAEVREALIRQTWTLAYNVEYAGVNQFSIEMPKAIGEDVQIDGVNIKERAKIENKDAAGAPTGSVTWRVTLQDKVLGAYQLRFSHDNARGEVKPGATASVVLDEVKPLDVTRETGQVAVVKDGNVEITKSDASGLELIDPKELTPLLQTDGVFLAYKYAAHPIALRLDVSKNLYLEVPQAVVSYAVLTSVIAED
ncbi:MAG: hypothetical protein JWL90_3748, partial [Chthoniobacteraceae bacterium]|nr:hypothetical protein [Chthoniobacteraceae bacterium]